MHTLEAPTIRLDHEEVTTLLTVQYYLFVIGLFNQKSYIGQLTSYLRVETDEWKKKSGELTQEDVSNLIDDIERILFVGKEDVDGLVQKGEAITKRLSYGEDKEFGEGSLDERTRTKLEKILEYLKKRQLTKTRKFTE